MTDGGVVNLESGIPYESIRELMEPGHQVQSSQWRVMGDTRPSCGMRKMECILELQSPGRMDRLQGIRTWILEGPEPGNHQQGNDQCQDVEW